MSLAMIVYLISVLPKVAGFMTFMAIMMFTAFGCNILIWVVNKSTGDDTPIIKSLAVIFVLCAAIAGAIPSEKQMYVIAGAYAAQNVYDSEIGQDTIKLLHSKIKEQIVEQTEKAMGETTEAVKKVVQKEIKEATE